LDLINGSINFESIENEGTIFKIEIYLTWKKY
jgi:chemotaxis protein histidine kinase CheA